MQAAPSKRARFLHIVGGLLIGSLLAVSTGCSDPAAQTSSYSPFGPVDTIASTDVPRDSVLALLEGMNRTPFDSAFARLDDYSVTRHVRTEQLDTTGAITAYRTMTLHYPTGAERASVRRTDSAGAFRGGGVLSSITPAERRTARPENLATQALADQPAYLAPRTQEAYRYALRRDSLSDGTPAYVVEAKARLTGRGAEQGIRFARLTIEAPSRQLVGITAVRASRILLFHENSVITLRLRRAPAPADTTAEPAGDHWVPHVTRVRALVDVPLRLPRQYRTVSAYYGYAAR